MRLRSQLSALLLLVAEASVSYANKTGGSVFILLGTGGPGDYTCSLNFVNSQGRTVTFGPTPRGRVTVSPGRGPRAQPSR